MINVCFNFDCYHRKVAKEFSLWGVWFVKLLALPRTRRESLSFLKLERTRGHLKWPRESWELTREPRRREKRCPAYSARWGNFSTALNFPHYVWIYPVSVNIHCNYVSSCILKPFPLNIFLIQSWWRCREEEMKLVWVKWSF